MEKWVRQLGSLQGWRRRVMLAALAERSLPHLQLYAELQDRRKMGRQLLGLMAQIWEAIEQPARKADRSGAGPLGAASGKRKDHVSKHKQLSVDPWAVQAVLPVQDDARGRLLGEWERMVLADDSFGGQAAAHSLYLLEQAASAVLDRLEVPLAEVAARSANFVMAFVELQGGADTTDHLGKDDATGDEDDELAGLRDHPLAKAELDWQRSLVRSLIAHTGPPTTALLQVLREEASNDATSGIGISLDT